MTDEYTGDRWTLGAADRSLLGNKSGATRLGFAVLLKLFQAEGRFPRRPEDVPAAAVEAIAPQVRVPAAAWRGYGWDGRAIRYHRARIRTALGSAKPPTTTRPRWLADSKAGCSTWSAGTTASWLRRASSAGS